MNSQIVSADAIGEPGTGFEKAGSKGPFECGNCEYMKDSSCHQPVMLKVSKQPKNTQGFIPVGEHDCCEYVDRVGNMARKASFFNSKVQEIQQKTGKGKPHSSSPEGKPRGEHGYDRPAESVRHPGALNRAKRRM